MAKFTKTDRLINGLIALGFTEIQYSRRYRTFEYPPEYTNCRDTGLKIFVGGRGAFRLGRDVANSRDHTGSHIHRKVLEYSND